MPFVLINAGATQTETSLLKQYVASERVDLLDHYGLCCHFCMLCKSSTTRLINAVLGWFAKLPLIRSSLNFLLPQGRAVSEKLILFFGTAHQKSTPSENTQSYNILATHRCLSFLRCPLTTQPGNGLKPFKIFLSILIFFFQWQVQDMANMATSIDF